MFDKRQQLMASVARLLRLAGGNGRHNVAPMFMKLLDNARLVGQVTQVLLNIFQQDRLHTAYQMQQDHIV